MQLPLFAQEPAESRDCPECESNNYQAAVPLATAQAVLGVANWNSHYPDSSLPSLLQGARDALTLGVQNLKVAMGPNYQTLDYADTDFGTVSTLTELAKSPPFHALFSMPFQVFAIDTVGLQDGNILEDVHVTQVYSEMYDFVTYLLQTYQGSGKTFILQNWEGDNQLAVELGSPQPPPREVQLANMRTWLQTRHDALRQAVHDAGDISGVQVKDAIEFNSVECAVVGRSPCVLTDIVPLVDSDLISYSSYESLTHAIPADSAEALQQKIFDDLDVIRNYAGERPIYIGEFGFPANALGSCEAGRRTRAAAQAFIDAGLLLAFDWQIKDGGSNAQDSGYGLIDDSGRKTCAWHALHGLLDPAAPTCRVNAAEAAGARMGKP
jgi:hypothetical protein